MNFELRKFVAPELLMGTNVRLLAGNYFQSLGVQKIMIVTDKNISQQFWFSDIIDQLHKEQVQYIVYDEVSPNSPHPEVMTGVEIFRNQNCEGILAIGGGSIMDSGKGIGIVYSNKGNILDYEGVDKIVYPTPPIVCIPSTSGTSSDVSQFSIIRNMDELYKIAIVSKSLVPDLSLLDPIVSTTMDKYLTACTGLDALTHAIEAFVSTGNSSLTDFHALNAITLIKDNLLLAYNEPKNMSYRYNMMIASLEAGLAFSNASLGAIHAMAHSLGGLYNIPHGECNAILLNHVVKFNYNKVPERYNKIGETLGLNLSKYTSNEKSKLIFDEINKIKETVEISNTLNTLGVKKTDFSKISKQTIVDPCIFTNPIKASVDDINAILAEAM